MTADGSLDRLVREYLHAVVNERDVSAVGTRVAPDYEGRGHGWPVDREALTAFYQWQATHRPTWRIAVRERTDG
jgi:hypothetical protein